MLSACLDPAFHASSLRLPQNILAAVNSLAAPVVFEYRTQQPSAPGQLPAVDGATVKDPPVKKVSGKAGKAAAGDGAGTEPAAAAGSDATAADTEAAAAAAAADPFAAESMGAAGQTAQRRLLRARRLGQGAAAAAAGAVAAPTSRGLLQEAETANSCPKPKYQFEVQTAAECEGALWVPAEAGLQACAAIAAGGPNHRPILRLQRGLQQLQARPTACCPGCIFALKALSGCLRREVQP